MFRCLNYEKNNWEFGLRNLLIVGGEHDDRINYATRLVTLELCNDVQNNEPCGACNVCLRINKKIHPNVFFIEPGELQENQDEETYTSTEVKIDQVRKINEENAKANFEEGASFFIFTHMHMITRGAANALLKTLEESNAGKVFLALAPSRMSVLPTIASRLVMCPIKPRGHFKLDETLATKIRSISSMAPTDRWQFCATFATTKSELLQEISQLTQTNFLLLRSNHLDNAREYSPMLALKLGEALNEASEQLSRNLNPKLVVENLLFTAWPLAK